MLPCTQVETIKEIKQDLKKIEIIEKSHIRLTVIQQQILKKQEIVDSKLSWLLFTIITALITIVLFYVFGIGGN